MYLETNRLYLRLFHPSDYYDLYEYLSDPKVVQYEQYSTFTLKQCRAEAIMRSKNPSYLAVILKDYGKLIGNLYFVEHSFMTWEIGYIFNQFYHHKGYAYESCCKLFHYAFTQKDIRRIVAKCAAENTPSWKLMEHLGMRREGYCRSDTFYQITSSGAPVWKDSLYYGILQSEYFAQHPEYLSVELKK